MEDKQPLLSVIIPVYNTEKYVERCLDSVFQQTYKNIEIIVVNNGSKGNIDEIIEGYKLAYPQYKIMEVKHEENQGLFKARVSGVEASTGEYIAFIDSDDRVSHDFYSTLIKKAKETNSDIVIANYADEFADGRIVYNNLDHFVIKYWDLKNEEILDTFYAQEGSCLSWHVIWNKIYSKDLWNESLKYIKQQKEHLVMCEDIAFSTAFFSCAKRVTSVQNVHYFYYRHDKAATGISSDIRKYEKNIKDVAVAFNFAKSILIQKNFYKKYEKHFFNWEDLYISYWYDSIEMSSMSTLNKYRCENYLKKLFNKENLKRTTPQDNMYYSIKTDLDISEEKIIEEITNDEIKIISFDIFDTLILRPFWEPYDLFKLMNDYFFSLVPNSSFADFQTLRSNAENQARLRILGENKSFQDITLDEIYEEFELLYNIDTKIAELLKLKEKELEIKYCYERQYGKKIFNIAKACHKRIIVTSDMYLPIDTIQKILDKNGYNGIEKIFLSSNFRETKNSGALYKEVLSYIMPLNNTSIVHIGDNYYSDIQVAFNYKIKSVYLPKTTELFKNQVYNKFCGDSFTSIFGIESNNSTLRPSSALSFLGVRCMLAIIANKFFDNPNISFNADSDFNSNPYYIGYFALGMNMFGIANWLIKSGIKCNASKIHFMARDGYLPMKVYQELKKKYDNAPESNYLRVSRKAMMPLFITDKTDIFAIPEVLDYHKYTPRKVIEVLSPIIPESEYIKAEQIFKTHSIVSNKNFDTYEEFTLFLNLFSNQFFNEPCIANYRQIMQSYFLKIIGNNDISFDIGYSARREAMLTKLLKFPVNTYYIHFNDNVAMKNAKRNNFKIHTYYNFTPAVSSALREYFLSELGPSCKGFKIENSQATIIKDNYRNTFKNSFLISVMQEGAIDFTNDFINKFGDILDLLEYRDMDVSLPFEYYLSNSKQADRDIFKYVLFYDELIPGENHFTVSQLWNFEFSLSNKNDKLMGNLDIIPRWKRVVLFALFDRKTLKEKVKKNFAGHPILLKIMKVGYSIPRGIKRAVRK